MSDTSHQDQVRFENEMIVIGKLEELVERLEASAIPLRDRLAGEALKGLLSNPETGDGFTHRQYACEAYMIADEMVIARDRER